MHPSRAAAVFPRTPLGRTHLHPPPTTAQDADTPSKLGVQKQLLQRRLCPTEAHPPKHGQPSLSPKLWPQRRLSRTPSRARAQSHSSSPGSTGLRHVMPPACASSPAPRSGGISAETRLPFPITGFTQRVPCAKSHIPAFFGQRPTSRHEACAQIPCRQRRRRGPR